MKRSRSSPATPFRISPARIAAAIGILILSGCATTRPPPASEPAPEIQPQSQPVPSPKIARKPKPAAPVPAKTEPPAPAPSPIETPAHQPAPATAGQLTIRVETHPQGAVIVVDGRPVGRSPIDVVVDTANNGFFKQPVTIRARFLATDENSETFSVDEQLGPLERVPLALVFSKDGVQRILRQF